MSPKNKAKDGRLEFLRLFVAGDDPNSLLAKKNLEHILRQSGIDPALVEVIDVYQNHQAALENRVFLTPTLLVGLGGTVARVVGNLHDVDSVVRQLESSPHD